MLVSSAATVASTVGGPSWRLPADTVGAPPIFPTIIVPDGYASQVSFRAQLVGLLAAPFEFNNVRTLADGTRQWFAGISVRGHAMWKDAAGSFPGNQYTRLKRGVLWIGRTARAFGTATFGIGTATAGYDAVDGMVSGEYGRAAMGVTDMGVGATALAVGGPPGWAIGAGYTIVKEGVPRGIALEVQLCNEGACPLIISP